MTNPWFQFGAAFAGLVALAVGVFEGDALAERLGVGASAEPVLVFEIPHPQHFAQVRSAISTDRVFEEGQGGFSLRGGRVYVQDVGEAGDLIERAGWVERPIQIVSLGMDDESEAGADDKPAPISREEREARLRSLVNKPSLTRGEQIFVLSAMNDGIEI